jgi:hypothetical protein
VLYATASRIAHHKCLLPTGSVYDRIKRELVTLRLENNGLHLAVAALARAQKDVAAASSEHRERHALQATELANLWAANSELEARLEALVQSCGMERAISREDLAILQKVGLMSVYLNKDQFTSHPERRRPRMPQTVSGYMQQYFHHLGCLLGSAMWKMSGCSYCVIVRAHMF